MSDKAQDLAEAVADGLAEVPPSAVEAVSGELDELWGDLDSALRDDNRLSMHAMNLVARITRLIAVNGGWSWERVPWPLILDGTYEAVMKAIGVPFDRPTEDDLAHLRDFRDRQRDA